MSEDFQHAADVVRRFDRDRYLAALLAPEEHRDGLMALYAYAAEISRVREIVSEPLPGEIRLQWWRDFLGGTEHGEASANPVASALHRTIERYQLSRPALIAMAEARIFDLYNDPMPSLNDLEGYAGETVSAVFQMAAQILNGGEVPDTATASGHAGVAFGLTGLLRALPWHAARQQMYLPQDLIQRHNVDVASVFRGESSVELKSALAEMRDHVRHHLNRVKQASDSVPRSCRTAFLTLALVEPFLQKMEGAAYDPLKGGAELSPLRQWLLWRARTKIFERI